MNFDRTGIILYVTAYDACVKFYQDILGLKVIFQNEVLTCFDFDGTYLMVEVDDTPNLAPRTEDEPDRTCLRMNVADVKAYTKRLDAQEIPYRYGEYDWGTIAKFRDPDGNLCAFKDSEKFEIQVQGGK